MHATLAAVLAAAATAAVKDPPACGSACNDGVHDCDSNSTCGLCAPVPGKNATFACSAGCGQLCTGDADCGTDGCNACVDLGKGKVCNPHALSKCGGPCSDGKNDCDQHGTCDLCAPKGTSGKEFHCSAGCGATCEADEQCGTQLCGKCNKGVCAAQPAPPPPPGPPMPTSKCGGPCADAKHNCDTKSECAQCVPVDGSNTSFVCAAGCGAACTEDAHCGAQGCGNCVNSTCTPRALSTCGGPCNDGKNDCDSSAECALCIPAADNKTFACGVGCGGACTEDGHCSTKGCNKCNGNKTCSV